MNKHIIFNHYLPVKLDTHRATARAFAPSNIALCKYWGKRDVTLNLPINSSLSVSLGELGTTTTVSHHERDEVWLNGEQVDVADKFAQKVLEFVNLFRREQRIPLKIETHNSIPTGAGLASSASGFAALTLALNDLFSLDLPRSTLSQLARMGSGSASRSLFHGFVEWEKGEQDDGSDSFATPLADKWDDFCIGILTLTEKPKPIDSRAGMQRTVETAMLYQSWAAQAERDLSLIKTAITARDLDLLGKTAEHNALSMHATMIASQPPLLYWLPESVDVMHKVWALRAQGLSLYLTMDAGPNVKLLFSTQQKSDVIAAFPALQIVIPFATSHQITES